MKKKIIVWIIAFFCTAVCSYGLESEIVGYTTKTIPANTRMMIAVQFDKTDGTQFEFDEAFHLDAVGPKAWESAEDEDCIPGWHTDAPELQIPVGTVNRGYRDLWWCQNAWDDDLGDFVEGWADLQGMYITSQRMLRDHGVWLIAGTNDMKVTMNGMVKSAASDTISASAGWNMLKLPYPMTLNVDDPKIDWNLAGVDAWVTTNDESCVFDWYVTAPVLRIQENAIDKVPYTIDKAYRDLYYSSKTWDNELCDFVEGWANADGFHAADATIPEGVAFWFVVTNAVISTISKE